MSPDNGSVLVLFFGLPGSGKTTLVNRILEACQKPVDRRLHPCIISYDSLVNASTQAEMAHNRGLAKECRRQLLFAVQAWLAWFRGTNGAMPTSSELASAMLEQLQSCSSPVSPHERALILVDDNLYYRSMRKEWFKLAQNASLGFCQVLVSCPLEEALRRNASRELPVPEATIRVMDSKLELPRGEPWEELAITVAGEAESIECVLALVERASTKGSLRRPESPLPVRKHVPPSRRHCWDLKLRAIVSTLIQQIRTEGSSQARVADRCIQLQKARQAVLERLRKLPCEEDDAAQVDLHALLDEALGE
ncbi:unnamed protein product [Ixodes hexagonus]